MVLGWEIYLSFCVSERKSHHGLTFPCHVPFLAAYIHPRAYTLIWKKNILKFSTCIRIIRDILKSQLPLKIFLFLCCVFIVFMEEIEPIFCNHSKKNRPKLKRQPILLLRIIFYTRCGSTIRNRWRYGLIILHFYLVRFFFPKIIATHIAKRCESIYIFKQP